VRELLTGPGRYGDLREGLPGTATNLPAGRLRHLGEPLAGGRAPLQAAADERDLAGVLEVVRDRAHQAWPERDRLVGRGHDGAAVPAAVGERDGAFPRVVI
jgi:hypothetical protein